MNKGLVYVLSAYIFWGLHPIYWKLLKHISPTIIVSHRIIWSFLFFCVIIIIKNQWKTLITKVRNSNNKKMIFLPAFLIGANWLTYIWAVNTGYIIETSLGYFICPLIIVLLGVLFLEESLRKMQWFAVSLAIIGVLIMTFVYGQFPWVALFLAGTWGFYVFLRKASPLNSLEGLTLETALLSIPAAIYLLFYNTAGSDYLVNDNYSFILLMVTGIISGLPLLFFINGSRQIKLSLIGILQYIYPTIVFIIGAFIYGEELSLAKMAGFAFIWLALLIYSSETLILKMIKKIEVVNEQ
ncbi:MAG: EamA family transporter RarD [bacterium]